MVLLSAVLEVTEDELEVHPLPADQLVGEAGVVVVGGEEDAAGVVEPFLEHGLCSGVSGLCRGDMSRTSRGMRER